MISLHLNRRYLIIGGIILIFLALALGSFFFFRSRTATHTVSLEPSPTPLPTAIPTPPKDAANLNILLLGYGGAGHEGGYLTDVIMLAHFNFQKNILALISIPRDLYVAYPDGISRKVNAAYALKTKTTAYPKENVAGQEAKDAGSAVKSVIQTITGLPVTYFIGIDFTGFERLVGSLGGIDVQVTTPLDDPFYPIRGQELNLCNFTPEQVTQMTATMSGFTLEKQFTCRYEHLHYDVGTHHMDGGDALKFVRSRHSSSDFARSERQQSVLNALKLKLISLGALTKLPDMFTDLSQYTRTDLDTNVVNYLSPALQSLPNMQIVKINLSTQNVLVSSTANTGAFILVPKTGANDWSGIKNHIQSQLNAAASAAPTPTLPQIREKQ